MPPAAPASSLADIRALHYHMLAHHARGELAQYFRYNQQIHQRIIDCAGNATLATVAPGIAEALIATAIGLFAAIPAVVAYNRFAYDIDRFATRFDTFMEEFSNILQRQAAK